ncbi:cyclic AMP-dependent transcription factor ATF-7-like [Macrosteles quadrilineatus]|uniref:cyclic AMP-dependent transcription factor ATF-7-like n=1 Tax=Macrosteles quadrilineatus TaxID=74068 RepID=UPI0023E2673B|nr:cyclic AMP-dependent transcription factor ATF-7-like [Macrosteles quadrilineatus]
MITAMEGSSRSYSTHDYPLACSTKEYMSSPPKKKHSMVLNLGNRSSSIFGADQTPTPTRFIRNCEEVGLFQDLQNVNPFEETFRKAVESGKTGSLALQETRMAAVTDDTLHTPHVFPHIIENESINRIESTQKQPVQNKTVNGAERECGYKPTPPVKVIRQEADTSQLRPIAPSSNSKPGTSGYQPVQLLLKMPDGRLMQLNATPVDSDKKVDLQGPVDLVARVSQPKADAGTVILHTSPEKKQESDNISPLIKEKLKARLGNLSANIQAERPNMDDPKIFERGHREEGSHHKRSSSTSNASNSEDDEETKRRKFLERNRAAAMRCREKRKFWVATLEQRAEKMMTANQQLQLEVGALRAEVAHLKTLLLAHKDCPVTQAMCNNGAMAAGSVMIPVEVEPLVIKPLNLVELSKPLTMEEAVFRQNLKKKLRTVSVKKTSSQNDKEKKNQNIIPKKRLSLDIGSAKQSQCLDGENSTLVKSAQYFSSTLLSSEPLELDSFKDMARPVATQVIQVNPNALFRDSGGVRISPPIMEGALLPLTLSSQTNCIDYS